MSDLVLVAIVAGSSNIATGIIAYFAATSRFRVLVAMLTQQYESCQKAEQRLYDEVQVYKAIAETGRGVSTELLLRAERGRH